MAWAGFQFGGMAWGSLMDLDYIPLLHEQCALYQRPRDMSRFQAYLRLVLEPDRQDVRLPPLVAINPMAGPRVAKLLDTLVEMDADRIALDALASLPDQTSKVSGSVPASLIVVDDAGGGWTNRAAVDAHFRFDQSSWGERAWIVGILWSSEPPSVDAIRLAIRSAAYRLAYQRLNGLPRSLRDRMAQEGRVLALAGFVRPWLDAEDLEYTRQVLQPYLEETDARRTIECLFGDEAARSLGMTPLGLSPCAGLAVALEDALQDGNLAMGFGLRAHDSIQSPG